MILPTKHTRVDRALIGVGAEILAIIRKPLTVSRLWSEMSIRRMEATPNSPLAYEWFVLALDLLYAIGAIKLDRGLVRKVAE